jgi:cytochrome b-561
VHNVAEYGPYNPASTPEVIMPDWFLMWVFGFLKIWPSWLTFHVGPLHFSSEFLGGIVLPGIVFAVVFAWPFIDRTEEGVHFTADPLDRAWQTAAGVAGVVFVMIASIAGMNVLLADAVGVPTSALTNPLRIALLGGPVLAFGLIYWLLSDDEGDGEEASPDEGDAADSEEVPADD